MMEPYLQIRSMEDVKRLIAGHIEESSALEYKAALALGSDREKREVLKDLTGMGNGGGGTIIFGVEEDPQHLGVPTAITRLTNPTLQGRLDDVARSGIRPPLVATSQRIGDSAGYVLVVHIWPSPLGPYMVEAYGERRFYYRNGKSTLPMNEQRVRDAYALALRAHDRRPEVWREHELPIAPESLPGAPCLTVAGLPEEPLTEAIDLSSVTNADLAPPPDVAPSARLGGVEAVLRSLRVWANGLYGEAGMFVFRLYRDGAAGLATVFNENLHPWYLARVIHGQLMYMAWLWQRFVARQPVELRLEMRGLERVEFPGIFATPPTLQRPTGLTRSPFPAFSATYVPWQLARAQVRNVGVWRFMQRVHQAVGLQDTPDWLFRQGWLYGREGGRLPLGLHQGAIFAPPRELVGRVYDDGHIERERDGQLVAHVKDGVILDLSGDTLAVVEMAVGGGVPDDFKPQSHAEPVAANLLEVIPAQQPVPVPAPSGRWSQTDLRTLLSTHALP